MRGPVMRYRTGLRADCCFFEVEFFQRNSTKADFDSLYFTEGMDLPNRSFDSIYADFSRLVFWAAFNVVRSKETAEDITQSVFERVIINQQKLSDMSDAQLKGWLYRVAVNLALDIKRKAKHELPMDEPISQNVQEGSPLPEDVLVKTEMMRILQAEIDALDDIYREVIILHYFSRMTTREISDNTGVSEGTVKSRLVRARNLLAQQLKTGGYL